MRINKGKAAQQLARTHEGAPAYAGLSDEQRLRRSVLSCMLWEDEFYEDGETDLGAHRGAGGGARPEDRGPAGDRGARR